MQKPRSKEQEEECSRRITAFRERCTCDIQPEHGLLVSLFIFFGMFTDFLKLIVQTINTRPFQNIDDLPKYLPYLQEFEEVQRSDRFQIPEDWKSQPYVELRVVNAT